MPMDPLVLLGLAFAVMTAVTSVVGFLMKHRGAVDAPRIEASRPIRSSLLLFRSPWYTAGILVAVGSWGFHVAALALAPISLGQAVIAGGLVFLTVFADRIFGLTVSRREWIGVALAALGLAILAASLEGAAGEGAHNHYDAPVLLAYTGVTMIVAVGTAVWARSTPNGGPALGVSAGLLWGASDVAIKALTGHMDDGFVATLLNPFVLVVVVASLVGMTVSARSLQIGPAVPVITVTAAAANITTIASGSVVFDEPFPDEVAGILLRLAAFALVIVAAALTPPRAEPVADPEETDVVGAAS